jgi:plastocyanin
MLKLRSWILLIAALATIGLGCDRHDTSASDGGAAPAPRAQPKYGSATIEGTVRFIGNPPPREKIANQPCHAGAPPLLDETVVVNENGTLANVFVYLEGAGPSDGSKNSPAVLDQKDCRYVPHAVAVQTGQTLKIRSSDPTMHNVHYNPQLNPPGNFGFTIAGSEKTTTFDKPEFIRVKCDVHPWMTAYLGVFDSPFFATTGEPGGKFQIKRVPAGSYTLVAWHEQFGRLEQPVTVKDNAAINVKFEYKAP